MNTKIVSLYTITFLIIGAVLAGVFAVSNQTKSENNFQILTASMIEPTPAAVSPRTYNQTLVESIDIDSWQQQLVTAGYPEPTNVLFDVLPDSFNIQTTVGFSASLTDEQKSSLPGQLSTMLGADSQALTGRLFTGTTAKVVLTKTVGESAVIQQNPVAATIYGAIAGALFGLFLGLALSDSKK